MTYHYDTKLRFGAQLHPDGTTRFSLWAPSVPSITLEIEGRPPIAMDAHSDGWFSVVVPAPAGTAYQFRLPDGLVVPDPASRLQRDDVGGKSIVVDPRDYAWTTPDWPGRPWHETVLYEVHPGLMGGFDGIRARLDELVDLGITAIELMPIADFPGPRNWGYDGVLQYAPDTAYGTPNQLKALVDAAHSRGLMVFLDVVYNHFGPDGNYLHSYADAFFDEAEHTPWGAAIDFSKTPVRDFFVENALYWLDEFRIDGLRFDAIHAISDVAFVADLARTIRARTEPGRHRHLVLEHEGNKASLLRETQHGPLFDAQWADDVHHCFHVLLTGETEGYYDAFHDATRLLARCLSEGFAYQGETPPGGEKPRGEPSAHLPPTAFVAFLQNHDQTGNRAFGDRLTTLSDPDKLRAATAMLLLSPMIPLLFMGEEWATRRPFNFFTSHNDDLAQLVREGRRREFARFPAFRDEAQRERIPDPNAIETYESSRPDQADSDHRGFVRHLLTLRREDIVPGLPGCRPAGATVLADGAVRAEWVMRDGAHLTLAINLGQGAVDLGPIAGRVLMTLPARLSGHLPPAGFIAALSDGPKR